MILGMGIDENNQLKIIDEKVLLANFPEAYRYLYSNKDILATRDKGKKEYEKWYAFGRNQALTIKGNKLFFPYISDKPYFVFSDNQDLLFYNGYAIISDDNKQLLILSKILNSNIFWYYIRNSSKPYSSDYYAFAKNYIIDFGICDLNEDEAQFILATDDNKLLDDFLFSKYQVFIIDIRLSPIESVWGSFYSPWPAPGTMKIANFLIKQKLAIFDLRYCSQLVPDEKVLIIVL